MKIYITVVGDIKKGFRFYGPFAEEDYAYHFGSTKAEMAGGTGYEYEVIKLLDPRLPKK